VRRALPCIGVKHVRRSARTELCNRRAGAARWGAIATAFSGETRNGGGRGK
jgi:hypothetical protein